MAGAAVGGAAVGGVAGMATGAAGVTEGVEGLAAGTATGGVAAAGGLAVVGATFGDGLAGVAWGTTGAAGFGVGAADGDALAGEALGSTGAAGFGVGAADGDALAGTACESCGVAAGCGVRAPEGKAVAAPDGEAVDAMVTEADWVAAPPDTAGGIDGVTVVGRGAGVSGTGFRTSAARLGLAAPTTNPTRGRRARVRREPAEGRSTILRGLAPAMEGERLVRQSRESG